MLWVSKSNQAANWNKIYLSHESFDVGLDTANRIDKMSYFGTQDNFAPPIQLPCIANLPCMSISPPHHIRAMLPQGPGISLAPLPSILQWNGNIDVPYLLSHPPVMHPL